MSGAADKLQKGQVEEDSPASNNAKELAHTDAIDDDP